MRVAIMPQFGIGDVIMASPMIRNLKEKAGAHITCIHMFKTCRDVLINNPCVDEHLLFPLTTAGRLAGIRFFLGLRGRFDASINLYPTNRKDYNLAAFLVGAKLRIGHRYREANFTELNFLKNRLMTEHPQLHNVRENIRLIGPLGVTEPDEHPLEVHLRAEDDAAGAEWLRARGLDDGRLLIGVHAGSSLFKSHAHKRWPAENFAAMIAGVCAAREDAVILMFGGAEELPLKNEIAAASGRPERVVTVETDGILGTAAIMKRCGVMVANDSGLMHLGAAMRVPSVAIFGPTDPVKLAPWGVKHRVLRFDPPCPPCFRYSPTPIACAYDGAFPCVQKIAVSDAVSAVLSLAG